MPAAFGPLSRIFRAATAKARTAPTQSMTRAEGVRCILQELEEGNPLPLRSLPEDLCRDNAGEVVMLTLTLPREENWSWLG